MRVSRTFLLALPVTVVAALAWRARVPLESLLFGKEEVVICASMESSPESYAQEPVAQDFEVLDSNGATGARGGSAGSHSPFDSKSFHSLVGVGGEVSQKVGGRFGGQRTARPGSAGESYAPVLEHGFKLTAEDRAVTFAADVDTGSYSNVRRMLCSEKRMPMPSAVRVEEFLNYFRYDVPTALPGSPIGAVLEVGDCPWAPGHRLARVTLATEELALGNRQPANLVFLVDVSGSMRPANKLGLLKRGLRLLVDGLEGRDRVAVIGYAGAAGVVLPSTVCSRKANILHAIEDLQAGGSTAGAMGIELAYRVAQKHYIPGGINRVILATDGDFNVGVSSREGLVELITEKARSGVFLTTLGFGTGALAEDKLEQLADHGNGHYAYIDSVHEARKVLVEELGAMLAVVAKDVKVQVQFDPSQVVAHRLVGYANRRLAHADFANDNKDGGELGAGHQVTALIELVPAGHELPSGLAPLAGDQEGLPGAGFPGSGLLRLEVRYKEPEEDTSRLLTWEANDEGASLASASPDFAFAAAVAWFARCLAEPDLDALVEIYHLASGSMGPDASSYRVGFLNLVDVAQWLQSTSKR